MSHSRTPALKLTSALLSLLILSLAAADARAQVAASPAPADAQQQAQPQDPLAEATALSARVFELHRQGKYDEAIQLAERALALREARLGETVLVAHTLNQLAVLYHTKGDLAKAEQALMKSLAIHEKVMGRESLNYARSLSGLAGLLRDKGELKRAEGRLVESLSILEKLKGVEPSTLVVVTNNLASLYQDQGRYGEAQEKYEQALRVQNGALGEDHPSVALTLNNLAVLHQLRGDLVAAERLLERVLSVRMKALGEAHPDSAVSLGNLAALYMGKGDAARAESLLARGLESMKKTYGDEHPSVAALLNNLADLRSGKGDLAGARQLFEKALRIRESVYGKEHPEVAASLNNLATVHRLAGDNAAARELTERSLAMHEKFLGGAHPDFALVLNNLGAINQYDGRYALAEEQLTRALKIREAALGARHPDVATTLNGMAELFWEKGELARSARLFERASGIREHNLALILATGSESQKRLYLETLANESSTILSFNAAAASDAAATRLALTTVLRRKGRVLDATAEQIGGLRRRADGQGRRLLDQLLEKRSSLANLIFSPASAGRTPAATRALAASLEADVERLESEVSALNSEFRTRAQPVTLERVRQSLPPGAALVEIVSYRQVVTKAQTASERFGEPHYAAYVLRRDGEPRFAALGRAASIDSAARAFRLALTRSPKPEVERAGRALDEMVMRPLRKLLGAERVVLLSPDGDLNLVPFGALVDERNRYLVEGYTINYLTSGRDVLRPAGAARSRQPPVVIADPSFDLALDAARPSPEAADASEAADAGASTRGGMGLRSGDLGEMRWLPLKETGAEASAIKNIMRDARVLAGAQATESALKQVAGPRILHVATHGFFLPDAPPGADGAGRGLAENPLLRSGLVLAGGNLRRGGTGEDAILTALEASALDLWGTKLVVLSACETGVGEIRSGDGVYGLRRALVLAGSEAQVMSLWKVSDEATRDLMIAYYKRLAAGEGRAAALRRVQIDALRGRGAAAAGPGRGLGDQSKGEKVDRSHPFFWAAFIQSGDWRPMN